MILWHALLGTDSCARKWLDGCCRWVVTEGFSREVTSKLRPEWQGNVSHVKNGGKRAGKGNSKCRVLKAGMSLVYSGKEECARALWGRRDQTRDNKDQSIHSLISLGNGMTFKHHNKVLQGFNLENAMTWFRILEYYSGCCAREYCRRPTGKKKRLSQWSRQEKMVLVQELWQWKIWVHVCRTYFLSNTGNFLLISRMSHKGKEYSKFRVWEGLFGSFLPNVFCLFYPLTEETLTKLHS